MKAEAADYLAKARQCLEGARTIAGVSLHHVAGREAYLAAFHAAEAYNFERTGKTVKTHRGLRATFSRLANDEPSIPGECLRLLAEGYEIKSVVDYGVGPEVRPITADEATSAIEAAASFIEIITKLLSSGSGASRSP
jgi:uncharacterized protein (UPF0332 family)